MSDVITPVEVTCFNRFVKYSVIVLLLISLVLCILVLDSILPFDISGCEPVNPHFSVVSRP